MDQFQQQIDIKLLYYIQQEIQDNEIVEKILWNNQNTDQVDKLIQSEQKVNVIGLYGTLESVSHYLEMKTKCKVKTDPEIIKWQNKGILCWACFEDTIFVSFMALDSFFTQPKFQESTEITVYRFLRDLCHTILLLPSKNILENWKSTTGHYYQEQDTIVQDFQIIKLNDSEIQINPVALKCENTHNGQLLQFSPGQGNIRVEQSAQSEADKQFEISDSLLLDIFLDLLRQQKTDIYQLNLDKFSIQVQNIIRKQSKDVKKQIEQTFDKHYEKSYQTIQPENWNRVVGLGNKLKQNKNIFQKIHSYLFDYLRSKLSIDKIEQMDNYKISDALKEHFDRTEYQKDVQYYQNDLMKIIQEYHNYFKQMQQQKDYNLTLLLANYKTEIQNELKQLSKQRGFFIDLQQYEFRYMTWKDTNSEPQTTIDQIKTEKISLTDIISPSKSQAIQILYFCQSSNNKQTFLIISQYNQASNQYEYIWIDAQQQKSQKIMNFIPDKFKKLIFHYELSNQILFLFNTKIGISLIQYNEDRKLIISEKNVACDEIFIDFCYLRYSECFILISKSYELFKWEISLKNIEKLKLNAEFSGNQNRSLNYLKVMGEGNGNYFILANNEKCDIYNFNNQNVAQILFKDYGIQSIGLNQVQLFYNDQDWFVCLLDHLRPVSIKIQNMISQQKIVSKNAKQDNLQYTNPYFDLVKGSVVKYGPTINLSKQATVCSLLYAQEDIYQILESYFNQVDFTTTDQLNSCDDIYAIEGPQVKANQLIFGILSRIGIQLCTIEKQILIPLCDGLRINQNLDHNVIRVLEKVEQIQFGILERLLQYEKSKLFIVSIMGRQSSGKSYLLNRIFGTRFGVSSARCTDGIWMSISKTNDTVFVLFDCEGLFSSRRALEDETMLLAFLSSISDMTILNQDLTFSRNLNELFLNLSKSIEQIRGEKLFKGKLLIAVRDVNQREKEGAQNELMRNIEAIKNNQSTGNFLSHLFNDQFKTILMSYFDTKQFDKDINELRKVFVNAAVNTNRWDDQKQLIRSMKIMLVQLEVKDHRSLEDHELDHAIQILQRKANNLWCTLQQKDIEEIQFTDIQDSFNDLFDYIQKQDHEENSTVKNNQKLKKYDSQIQEILKQRQNDILNKIDQDINTQTSLGNKEKLQRVKIEIKQFLLNQSNQYQLCLEQCSECFLYCRQRKNHVQRDFLQQMNNLQEYIMQLRKEIENNSQKISNKEDLENCEEQLRYLREEQVVLQNQIEFKIIQEQLEDEQSKLKSFFSSDSQISLQNFNKQLAMYFKLQIEDEIILNDNEQIIKKIQYDLEKNLENSNIMVQNAQSQLNSYQNMHQELINKLDMLDCDELMQQRLTLLQNIDQILNQVSTYRDQQEQLESKLNQTKVKLKQLEEQEIISKYLQDKSYDWKDILLQQNKKQKLEIAIQNLIDQHDCEIEQIRQETSHPEGIQAFIKQQINKWEEANIQIEGELLKLTSNINRYIQQFEEKKKREESFSSEQRQQKQNIKIELQKVDECILEKQIRTQQQQLWQNISVEFKNYYQKFIEINSEEQFVIQEQDQLTTIEDQNQKTYDQNKPFIPDEYHQIQMKQQSDMISEQQSREIQGLFLKRSLAILFPNYQEQVQNLCIQIDMLDVVIHELKEIENYETNSQIEQQDFQLLTNLSYQIEIKMNELEVERQNLLSCDDKINQIQMEIGNTNQDIQELDDKILKQKQLQKTDQENLNRIDLDLQQFNYITKIYQEIQDLTHKKLQFGPEEDIQIYQTLSEMESDLVQKNNQINQLIEQIQLQQLISEQEQLYAAKLVELENKQQFVSKQHKCGREKHNCDQICDGCRSSEVFCKEKAGHSEAKEGNQNHHLCANPSHYCIQKCRIAGCLKQCQNSFNHEDTIQHDCLQKHICNQICRFCSNQCDLNSTDHHDVHLCTVKQCAQECYFGTHSFSDEKRCLNTCAFSHSDSHELHICNNKNHSCQQKCQIPGICQIGAYVEQIKTWKTRDGLSFEYKVYKQVAQKIQCQSKFVQHKKDHSGPHECTEKHICDQRCPECEAYCTQQYGHTGKHKPHLHRNKEQQIFTALQGKDIGKLIIKEEGEEERQFSLSESCEPETCTRSCNRRSRAHFHLLECKGGDLCSEKYLNKGKKVARHQPQKYQGSNKFYDEILCESFWDHLGWENPIEPKQRLEVSLCNYYCDACGDKEKKYCTKEAWHTDSLNYCDHSFTCKETHNEIKGVDVQFVIDTTWSMESYIDMVKQTVIRLMQSTQPYFKSDPNGIQFSVVSYKDHCDPKVVDSIDFSSHDRAVSFINSLSAKGGGDYPEAMLDGLNEGADKSWRADTKKFMFLLADSPPHGVPKFHNYKDTYPDGCPCKLEENQVLMKIQSKGIELIVLKLNESLNQTMVVFKKIMSSIVHLNRISNEEFIKKIAELVCKQLEVREITLKIG